MKKFFKNSVIKTLCALTALSALIIASILNMTGIVAVAMSIGILGGMTVGRLTLNKEWKELDKKDYPVVARYVVMAVSGAITAQISWAAMLV